MNDILLIKKYLAGELDARAMHELERRALDDPFLADALEGYENAGKDQQKHLGDLSARLRNRTDGKVRMFTPRIQLSVAASLLVLIGIGAWLVTRTKNTTEVELKQVAANVKQAPKPEQPTISAPLQPATRAADTIARTPIQKRHVYSANADLDVTPPKADATANQSPAVAALQFKPDSNLNAAADKNIAPGYVSNTTTAKAQPPVDVLKSVPKVNDVIVQSLAVNNSKAKKARPMVPETLLNAHEENLDVQPASHGNYGTLVGVVTGNNQPLVGAIVKLSGADFGVVTDLNGRFVMHNVPDNKSLEVKSLGYTTRQVKLNGRDSITVSLEPNSNALAEVVTVAKPILNNNDDKSSGSAGVRPRAVWKALNSYLDKNAVSPDGKTGQVVLSFTVNGRGGLSGFTIVQSLGASADQKAKDLLSNGPVWAGNTDGRPHQVRITVSFQ
ncbi:MAG: carboxypeptidase-like regulatory domain-containing protein [Bacteroidetes bacterium]|nr:carboxypeptidase-like regulatory domain-containing protein [Bacteroidota bacterium]